MSLEERAKAAFEQDEREAAQAVRDADRHIYQLVVAAVTAWFTLMAEAPVQVAYTPMPPAARITPNDPRNHVEATWTIDGRRYRFLAFPTRERGGKLNRGRFDVLIAGEVWRSANSIVQLGESLAAEPDVRRQLADPAPSSADSPW